MPDKANRSYLEKELLTENFLNLPNFLSYSRLLMMPFFIFYAKKYYYSDYNSFYYLVTIFYLSLIYLTDYLDGKIARYLKKETIYGKYLDPVCDKLVALSCFTLIVLFFQLPIWVLFFSFIREVAGAYIGYFLFYKKGIQGSPNLYGKWGIVLGGFLIFYYVSIPIFQKYISIYFHYIPCLGYLLINALGMIGYYKDYLKENARRGT